MTAHHRNTGNAQPLRGVAGLETILLSESSELQSEDRCELLTKGRNSHRDYHRNRTLSQVIWCEHSPLTHERGATHPFLQNVFKEIMHSYAQAADHCAGHTVGETVHPAIYTPKHDTCGVDDKDNIDKEYYRRRDVGL